MLMQKVNIDDETPLYRPGFLSSRSGERLERTESSHDQWQDTMANIHLHWFSFRKKNIHYIKLTC